MDPGPNDVRCLAISRLSLIQRLRHEPPRHQLRQVLLSHEAAHLQGTEDDEEGGPHDLLCLGHFCHRLASVNRGLAVH